MRAHVIARIVMRTSNDVRRSLMRSCMVRFLHALIRHFYIRYRSSFYHFGHGTSSYFLPAASPLLQLEVHCAGHH
jgi:hypothetical protein